MVISILNVKNTNWHIEATHDKPATELHSPLMPEHESPLSFLRSKVNQYLKSHKLFYKVYEYKFLTTITQTWIEIINSRVYASYYFF